MSPALAGSVYRVRYLPSPDPPPAGASARIAGSLDYDHAGPPWLLPWPPQFGLAWTAALTQTIQEDTVRLCIDEPGKGGTYLHKLFPLELAFKHTVVDAQTVVFEERADTLAAAVISNVVGDNSQHSVT